MASAPINKVQDKNGDQFFPITHQQAVINDNGDDLVTILAGKLTGVTFNGTPATITSGVAAISASIPAAPGTLVTNKTTAQTASSGEAMSGTINLHKIAKTGTYSDLIGTPTIPSSLSDLSGTSDLQAIEALAGASGVLKKTAANTWALDTATFYKSDNSNSYAVAWTCQTLNTRNNINLTGAVSTIGDSDAINFDAQDRGHLAKISATYDHADWGATNIARGSLHLYAAEHTGLVEKVTIAPSEVGISGALKVDGAVWQTFGASQPGGGMLPNVPYKLGTLTGSVTFSLAAATDNTILNHYFWTFTAGSTAPSITWPAGITWIGGSAPTIHASKYYEISILDGVGVYMEV